MTEKSVQAAEGGLLYILLIPLVIMQAFVTIMLTLIGAVLTIMVGAVFWFCAAFKAASPSNASAERETSLSAQKSYLEADAPAPTQSARFGKRIPVLPGKQVIQAPDHSLAAAHVRGLDLHSASDLTNVLLAGRVDQVEILRQVTQVNIRIRLPSIYALAAMTAIGFFKSPSFMDRLGRVQMLARMTAIEWYEDGHLKSDILKIFEDELHKTYSS